MASSGSRIGVYVKGALRFALAITFAVGFAYAASVSSVEYFTTWALLLHAVYFFAYAFSDFIVVEHKTRDFMLFRAGLPIGSGVAISVAVSVTYLLAINWEEMYDEYCQEAQPCLDLSLEFVAAHFVPPLAYFIAFVLRTRQSPAQGRYQGEEPLVEPLRWWVCWNLMFQAILVPTLVYTQLFDIDETYGVGSKLGSVLIYWASALTWSLACVLI